MFHCGRRNATLSKPGCARLWLAAKTTRPDAWQGLSACVACPIGAENAGQPQAATAEACEGIRMVCPRCLCPAPRLINSRLCIGCYNRHGEVLSGRDRKGNRPHLTDRLWTARVAVHDGGLPRLVETPLVTGYVEVMVHAAKHARGSMAFGAAPLRLPGAQQAELWMAGGSAEPARVRRRAARPRRLEALQAEMPF